MNAIFGMFIQFIYEHMILYINLTSNNQRSKCEKSVQKRLRKVKNKYAHNNTIFS